MAEKDENKDKLEKDATSTDEKEEKKKKGDDEEEEKDDKKKDKDDEDDSDSEDDEESEAPVYEKKDRSHWEATVKKYNLDADIVEKQRNYLDKLEAMAEDALKRAEFFKDFTLPGYEAIEEESSSGGDGGGDDDEDSGDGEYDFDYESGWLGTIYAPTLGGINSQGDPSVTATGVKVKNFRTIAVDPKVIPYGSFVAIKADGVEKLTRIWHAEDTGGAIKGKHIDMCVSGDYAKNHSFKGDISVAIVKKGKNAQTARDNEKKGIDDIIK